MRLISVRDLRSRPGEVWKRLPVEKDLVVTSNGRPVAILSTVSEDTLDESLAALRRARAIEAVASSQNLSARQGRNSIEPDEIEEEIAAVRRKRRSR